MPVPETRYARSGDVHIAYSVTGDGPIDLVYVPGFVSHLELNWEDAAYARFLRRLASFSRLIVFDKRGTGMSDRVPADALPSLETRMDDVRAVLDAAGSERAALLGVSEGGPMCALYAATYPQRTTALIMLASYAVEDWPDAQIEAFCAWIEGHWGDGAEPLKLLAPSIAGDMHAQNWLGTYFRTAASPGAAIALTRMNSHIDVRDILHAVRVPALVLHRAGDGNIPPTLGREVAAAIPGARFVEVPGGDHFPWVGDQDAILAEIEEFLTGERPHHEPDRVLATVMYTDIVSSTEQLASVGDRKWHDLLEAHNVVVRRELARFRGREVSTAGDSFLATFDGPARAIRCARAIEDALRPLGIEVRAGLHTGECEIIGDDIGGIAVHTGARVAALAGGGEVLVSSTVKDLVAGSGIEFTDRGAHALKGVPGEWRIFAVTRA
jgi:pimeloyl-ACP methyl ester carboxylesterase